MVATMGLAGGVKGKPGRGATAPTLGMGTAVAFPSWDVKGLLLPALVTGLAVFLGMVELVQRRGGELEETAPLNATCLKGKEWHGISWQQKQTNKQKTSKHTMHGYEIWRAWADI